MEQTLPMGAPRGTIVTIFAAIKQGFRVPWIKSVLDIPAAAIPFVRAARLRPTARQIATRDPRRPLRLLISFVLLLSTGTEMQHVTLLASAPVEIVRAMVVVISQEEKRMRKIESERERSAITLDQTYFWRVRGNYKANHNPL